MMRIPPHPRRRGTGGGGDGISTGSAMNLQTILALLSVITASLILIVGIILLTGLFLPGRIPENYRYTLGGVMTAYALYRIGMAIARYRRREDNEDDHERS